MKKFVSIVLAAMLLLGCVPALATEATPTPNPNMEEVYVGTTEKNGAANFVEDKNTNSASQSTDVWLQVEAAGTIDVTVPLVVVFKTNIDGGKATTSDAYKITNNSSAAIKVTEVKVKDQKVNLNVNGQLTNMELVADAAVTESVYNKYSLKIKPDDQYARRIWIDEEDVTDTTKDWKNAGEFYTKTADAAETKGLWLIDKKDAGATEGKTSRVEMTLHTSKLTFVTKQPVDSIHQGVKLFNVAYTVKIDDSTLVGNDIKDDTTNHEYRYTTTQP